MSPAPLLPDTRRPGPRRLRLVRRFRTADGGATAVEFGLVAVPFLALLFAIIETAMTFWATQVLETALATASRQLYTGTFQKQYTDATAARTAFKSAVCANVRGVFNCNALVDVDVRKVTSFSSANLAPPINSAKQYDISSYGYVKPDRSEIAVVRASMQYPRFVSLPGPGTALANGKRLIVATNTFKTEPYE